MQGSGTAPCRVFADAVPRMVFLQERVQWLCSRQVWKAFSPRQVRLSGSGRPAGANLRPSWVEPLLGGFPVYDLTPAGVSHGRVCTPGRLRRRGAMLRETPPPPPAGDLLSCFAKKGGKEGDPASPVGLRPTPLRCSQRAAGAELALRAQTAAPDFPARCCSAVQTGFHGHRAFTDTGLGD